MIWLLRLYPAWWRVRYEDEFLALLGAQPVSLRIILDVLQGALDARLHPQIANSVRPLRRCSFCGKEQAAVRRLIAGPNVYICDECVTLCTQILAQQPPAAPGDLRITRPTGSRRSWLPWRSITARWRYRTDLPL